MVESPLRSTSAVIVLPDSPHLGEVSVTVWPKVLKEIPRKKEHFRAQQIIAAESGVTNTVYLLARSYAIEKLTSEIEAGAGEYLGNVDAMGGMLRAVANGYVQREIQRGRLRVSEIHRECRTRGGGREPVPERESRAWRFSASIRRWSAPRWSD